MTEETAIRIAEAVERVAQAAEGIAVFGLVAIFIAAGFYVAIISGMFNR